MRPSRGLPPRADRRLPLSAGLAQERRRLYALAGLSVGRGLTLRNGLHLDLGVAQRVVGARDNELKVGIWHRF
ncbi:hypothetical protein ACRARG_14555 [Pseudooceanicola sp. C21-150M6]